MAAVVTSDNLSPDTALMMMLASVNVALAATVIAPFILITLLDVNVISDPLAPAIAPD